jgi:hypothetical protein
MRTTGSRGLQRLVAALSAALAAAPGGQAAVLVAAARQDTDQLAQAAVAVAVAVGEGVAEVQVRGLEGGCHHLQAARRLARLWAD